MRQRLINYEITADTVEEIYDARLELIEKRQNE